VLSAGTAVVGETGVVLVFMGLKLWKIFLKRGKGEMKTLQEKRRKGILNYIY
jgi:hypothetical protein